VTNDNFAASLLSSRFVAHAEAALRQAARIGSGRQRERAAINAAPCAMRAYLPQTVLYCAR
jgi:hypothetical protein